MAALERIKVLYYSGFKLAPQGCCCILKSHHYKVVPDISVGGDAPKAILKVYEYTAGKKSNPKNWPIYIAKTGHKWYPSESITEHLLTLLGKSFQLKMADSRLCVINGQLRFLSRYFLKKEQRLVHGAEIYAGFLSNDRDFVEEIEAQKMARKFFTLQFTYDALKAGFPKNADSILKEFVKMLLFDALVGNNDRHFYNWAVVEHVENKHEPYFSPIYDTARGFFWNTTEKKILSLQPHSKEFIRFTEKYYNHSKPKVGLEGIKDIKDINHFNLAQFIIENEFGILQSEIQSFFNTDNLKRAIQSIDNEFAGLYSKARIDFIKNCLVNRFNQVFNF